MYSSDCVPCVDFCHRLLYILTSSRASSFSSGLQISISTDCKITDHILEISNKMWDFTEGCNSGNQTFRTIDYSYHRRFVPFVDFSYRGRFGPWIFCTIRGFFVPFVPRTFRTILGRFVPSLNSDVSMKLDDADDKPSTPRMDWWRHLTERRTDGW